MNKFLRNLFLLIPIIIFFGLSSFVVSAADETVDEDKLPIKYAVMEPSISPGVNQEEAEVCNYLGGTFVLLIGLTGVFSVLFLFLGAVEYMMGGANPSAKSDGKDRMWGAIIGLFITLISWLLLNSINPVLLDGCFEATGIVSLPPAEYTAPTNHNGPTITVTPIFLCLDPDSAYDEMQGVIATDPEDGNITDKVKVFGGQFTTDMPGTVVRKGPYEITFYVQDLDGNTASALRIAYVRVDCATFMLENDGSLVEPTP